MNDFCPFLEDEHLMEVKRCTAGVNFASVGPNRALCRLCRLSDLSTLPLCPNVEVYTYVHNSPEGGFMDIEFDCLADDLPAEARCQSCPDHFGQLLSVSVKESFLVSIPE